MNNLEIVKNKQMNKFIKFILLMVTSVILALVFDRVILQGVLGLSKLLDINFFIRYLTPTEIFSWSRIYFFSIFGIMASLIYLLGKEKSVKYRYVLALILFILLVCGKFTGSSIGYYDEILNDNTQEYNQTTLIGQNRAVRGDEWATEKPYYFAQIMKQENKLSYYNNNLALEGNDMIVSAFSPVNDPIVLARPDLWGFLFLPGDYAFSFYWCLRLILLGMSCFELIKLLTKNIKLSILGAVAIFFMPEIQWWLSQALMIMIYSANFAIVLFDRYLKSKKKKSRYLSLVGMGLFLMIFIFTLYPATQLPLAYLYLGILVYILIKNKDNKPFSIKRIIEYIIMFIPIIIVLLRYFHMSGDATNIILNTNYPGNLRSWDALLPKFELYKFINLFSSFKDPAIMNSCELSQFWTFMPFTLIATIVLIKKKGKEALSSLLILVPSLFLFIISRLPDIELIRNVLMFKFTYPVRITYAYGLGFVFLIVLLIYHALKNDKGKYLISRKISFLITIICTIITFIGVFTEPNIINYFDGLKLGRVILTLCIILINFMGFLLLYSTRKSIKIFTVLFISLSVISTIFINPLTKGTDSLFEKQSMQKIRELDKNANGRWMVSGNPTIANLVTAQGVARVSGTYYYPDFKMMDIIDKEHKYFETYNQFAHIDMRLTDGDIDISSYDRENDITTPAVNRIIYITLDIAKELNINYIFSCVGVPNSLLENGQVELEYESKDNGNWNIYKINY